MCPRCDKADSVVHQIFHCVHNADLWDVKLIDTITSSWDPGRADVAWGRGIRPNILTLRNRCDYVAQEYIHPDEPWRQGECFFPRRLRNIYTDGSGKTEVEGLHSAGYAAVHMKDGVVVRALWGPFS